MRDIMKSSLLLFLLGATAAFGRIPEPDHIIYGSVTLNGNTVTTGVVTARVPTATEPIATFTLGTAPYATGQYALSIPIDSIDPRDAGTARPGDTATIYVNNVSNTTVTIGERGAVQVLDLTGTQVPTLNVGNVSVVEGDTGTVDAVFQVQLTLATSLPVTFEYSTADGTAVAGTDYTAWAGSTTINPGQLLTTVSVPVFGNITQQSNRTFFLDIRNVTRATLGVARGIGTILDDDSTATLTIADISVTEGNTGTTDAVFTVTLSRPLTQVVTFTYATQNGTATAGADYTSATGSVNIPAGQTSAGVTVKVLGDTSIESDETFKLALSAPVNAAIARVESIATIVSDDRYLTFVEAQKNGISGAQGLGGVSALGVSAQGEHLYAAGTTENAVGVYTRSTSSGRLTFAQVLTNGVGGVRGIGGARSVAVAPDGGHVYVAGGTESSIAVFSRNTSSGALTFFEIIQNGGAGVSGLGGISSVAVSPDNKHTYACSRTDNAVVAFTRDAASGHLSFVESRFDGSGSVDGLDGASALAISTDGKYVYVAASRDNSVATFSRDAGTGRLTFLQVQKVVGLGGASSVAVTRDGRFVYAGGQTDHSVAIFSVGSDGALTYVGRQVGVAGLNGAAGVLATPDGQFVIVAGAGESALGVFSRSTTTGALTFAEAEVQAVAGVSGLGGVSAVANSPDGKFVYAAGTTVDSVAVFLVNQASVRVDPNGDGNITVSDIFYLVSYMFANGPPPAGFSDVNRDGIVSPADIFYLVSHFFAGGPPPP